MPTKKVKKLRIATMVTGHYRLPLSQKLIYAPARLAIDLSRELTQRGHDIVFYAPAGSHLPGIRIREVAIPPLRQLRGKARRNIFDDPDLTPTNDERLHNLWDQWLMAAILTDHRKKRFDLVHMHPVDRALPMAAAAPDLPFLSTLHDPITPWRAEMFRTLRSPNHQFIAISDAQRIAAPDLPYAATIYHGLNLHHYPFTDRPRQQLAFVGRMLPKKGPDVAIRAAQKAGVPIVLAGGPDRGEYWDKKIAPHLRSKTVRYVGVLPPHQTKKIYGRAAALLTPISWEEPFGLTFIEAMACGTPVITYDRGSAREIIRDGVTGYVVNNEREMIQAIKKIDRIDRHACRAWVEERFTTRRMIDDHEHLFATIASR